MYKTVSGVISRFSFQRGRGNDRFSENLVSRRRFCSLLARAAYFGILGRNVRTRPRSFDSFTRCVPSICERGLLSHSPAKYDRIQNNIYVTGGICIDSVFRLKRIRRPLSFAYIRYGVQLTRSSRRRESRDGRDESFFQSRYY